MFSGGGVTVAGVFTVVMKKIVEKLVADGKRLPYNIW